LKKRAHCGWCVGALIFGGFQAGLPDLSCYNKPKLGKLYQITRNYTKFPLNMANGRKIYQMDIKYTNIFHCKALQNLPKICIFGLKIYHLATLISSRTSFSLHAYLVGKLCDSPASEEAENLI
jgi:hypothetical protein